MPLSGMAARPLVSGAADTAVANNAPAPSAIEMMTFFIPNSSWLPFRSNRVNCQMFPKGACLPRNGFPARLLFLRVQCFGKDFQDEQTATGGYRRLPRIGDSGFRTITEQFDDKFAYRGPAADQQSEFRLTVRNDATINVDTVDHDIDTEYAV